MVGYLITVPLTDEDALRKGYVHIPGTPYVVYVKEPVKVQGTELHGAAGPLAVTFYVQDYTECKHLLHAEDAVSGEAKPDAQPPVGNAHVAEGCEKFAAQAENIMEREGTNV